MLVSHKIDVNDMLDAQQAWYGLYTEGQHSFWEFIGVDEVIFHVGSTYLGTELAHKKIKMLCSPHARTLMQVFIVRTGYHKKLPK